MENTLEVRWFVRGIPPALVRRWFQLECPGKLLDTETRQDWYAYQQPEYLKKFDKFPFTVANLEGVNLKLRQKNLELKLRQYEFGVHRFGNAKQSHVCDGQVEQWYKLSQQELIATLPSDGLLAQMGWISVHKQREQKIVQNVKSELTYLRINGEQWWSVAFEMNQNNLDRRSHSCFKEVVEQSCQTYYGPKLSATNSYGYGRWLLEFKPFAIPYDRLGVGKFS